MFRALDNWFAVVRRPFPWREDSSPYRVLVSEIMLQQTQATRVISFFEKWMQLFPTIEALATAQESEVIMAWEGLGYYSRARALHATAKILHDSHDGNIPDNLAELLRLPGIGPYTAGAILSFAFHKRAIAIDANVTRVLTRFSGEQEKKKLPALLESMIPEKTPWRFIEALIELGALVCRRTPECSQCPLSSHCHALATKTQLRPLSSPKKTLALFRNVYIFHHEGSLLLVKRSGKTVMSGLYEFPFFTSVKDGHSSQAMEASLHEYKEFIARTVSLSPVTHTFTNHKVTLYPTIVYLTQRVEFQDGSWVQLKELAHLPFSSGHRKITYLLINNTTSKD